MHDAEFLNISLFFSAISANIKGDGIVFFTIIYLISFFTLFLYNKLKYLKLFILPLVILLPWYVIRLYLHIPSFLDSSTGIHFERSVLVFLNMFKYLFNFYDFNLLYVIFIVSILINIFRKKLLKNIYLLIIVFSILSSYFVVFLATPLDPVAHINSLSDRMLYLITPLVIIYISTIHSNENRLRKI